MTASELLGIDEFNFITDDMLDDQAFGTENRKLADLRSEPKGTKRSLGNYSVEDLDLDHIDDDIRKNVLETLRRYEDIWNGRLGLI